MNLPNKISIFRMALCPVLFYFILAGYIPGNLYIAAAIFAVAAASDVVDGHIARKHNLVTDFGKLIDPIADKLIVMAALAAFVQLSFCGAWILLVVIARELVVTSFRTVAISKSIVIAADFWGKLKTASQTAAILTMLLERALFGRFYAGEIILIISAVLTIASGINYIYKNRAVLK